MQTFLFSRPIRSFGSTLLFNSFTKDVKIPLLSSSALLLQSRTATKKTGGSVRTPSNPLPKYRGFKANHGTTVVPGEILLRQKGRTFHPGTNVNIGRDFTLHSTVSGTVVVHYNIKNRRRIVSVDDGSLPTLFTKNYLKSVVSNSIDANKYLQLDYPERLDYVKKLVTEVDMAMKENYKQQQKEFNTNQGSRKHNLVDYTNIDLTTRI